MRIVMLLLYILLSKNAFGQRAVVSLPKMNMMYIGIENHLLNDNFIIPK